jgi:cytochrome P450 family 6
MILPIIITSAVLSFTYLTYLYFRKCYQFWKNIKVPYLEPSFPFGNVPEQLTMQKHFGYLMQNLYEKTKKLGDYVGFYCIMDPVLMVLSPEFAKTVLVKDFNYFIDRGVYCHPTKDLMAKTLFFLENEEWRHMRSKLLSTFSTSKLKVMILTMIYKSDELFEQLGCQLKKDATINMRDILERYMIDVTSSYAFGIESNSMADKDSTFRKMSLKMVDFPYFHSLRLYFSLLFKKTAHYLQLQFHNNDVNTYFSGAVKKSIEHRQQTGQQYNDYLQFLIDLDAKNTSKEPGYEAEVVKNKIKLTFPEIAAQSFVFQFSTLQTSTNIAAIAMYLLAINLNEQKIAREDVMNAIQSHDNDISYEALIEMNYLDNVLNGKLITL